MSTLIVVAHPDDEVLGAGGLAVGLSASGESVQCCILSGGAEARRGRPELDRLRDQTQKAHRLLGIQASIIGEFPNIAFNTVPHIDLVRFIEDAVRETAATRLVTHHPEDLNVDHRYTSQACQAAARLFQRIDGVPPLESLLFMEVLSSTDWAFAASRESFQPQAFYELGEDLLSRKLEAMACFDGVMRDFPHPRSEEIIRGLAALRGGQAGVKYAEAFQVGFARI